MIDWAFALVDILDQKFFCYCILMEQYTGQLYVCVDLFYAFLEVEGKERRLFRTHVRY